APHATHRRRGALHSARAAADRERSVARISPRSAQSVMSRSSMAAMADHYSNLLGPVYTWMVGDVDAALARSDLELDALSLPSQGAGRAVDLGAAFGIHAIPLARRGFSVVAIDSYQPLLQELASRAGSLTIRTVNADLLDFRLHARSADVI